MKKNVIIFVVLILLISGITYADTDGVWTLAKNVRGGTFGSDEQPVTHNYSFINPVFMNRTLTINTSLGRGLWSESNASDGVAGITSASGKSAIYGWAQNSASYSGYFEGGKFEINQSSNNILVMENGNVGIGTATPTAKLDVNGNISGGNIYSNNQIVATQSWTNSQNYVNKSYVDSKLGSGSYSQSFGTSGYQIFPSGLIIEWGHNDPAPSGKIIPLPIPFPHKFLNVVASEDVSWNAQETNGYAYPMGTLIINNDEFKLYQQWNYVPAYWVAIGY